MGGMSSRLAVGVAAVAIAIVTAALSAAEAPALRAGIHVEMAVSANAVPLPEADAQDALIVAISADGSIYLGVTRASRAEVGGRVKGALAGHPGRRLYIKADARTPFVAVNRVLAAARGAGAAAPFLLTAQHDRGDSLSAVPPKGLEVLAGAPAAGSVLVEALDVAQALTILVNHRRVDADELAAALKPLLKGRRRREVLLQSDGKLPFRDVVKIIDACRAFGAGVFVSTPGK